MSHKAKKKRRNRLWSINPHCCWCGRKTVLPDAYPQPKTQPDNMATIDHLRSRLHPERTAAQTYLDPPRSVLACKRCNEKRGAEEQLQLPEGELQRRARNGERNKSFDNRVKL